MVTFRESHELHISKIQRVVVVEGEDTAAVEIGEVVHTLVAVTVVVGHRLVAAGTAYRSLVGVEAADILAGVALRWVVRT